MGQVEGTCCCVADDSRQQNSQLKNIADLSEQNFKSQSTKKAKQQRQFLHESDSDQSSSGVQELSELLATDKELNKLVKQDVLTPRGRSKKKRAKRKNKQFSTESNYNEYEKLDEQSEFTPDTTTKSRKSLKTIHEISREGSDIASLNNSPGKKISQKSKKKQFVQQAQVALFVEKVKKRKPYSKNKKANCSNSDSQENSQISQQSLVKYRPVQKANYQKDITKCRKQSKHLLISDTFFTDDTNTKRTNRSSDPKGLSSSNQRQVNREPSKDSYSSGIYSENTSQQEEFDFQDSQSQTKDLYNSDVQRQHLVQNHVQDKYLAQDFYHKSSTQEKDLVQCDFQKKKDKKKNQNKIDIPKEWDLQLFSPRENRESTPNKFSSKVPPAAYHTPKWSKEIPEFKQDDNVQEKRKGNNQFA